MSTTPKSSEDLLGGKFVIIHFHTHTYTHTQAAQNYASVCVCVGICQ